MTAPARKHHFSDLLARKYENLFFNRNKCLAFNDLHYVNEKQNHFI